MLKSVLISTFSINNSDNNSDNKIIDSQILKDLITYKNQINIDKNLKYWDNTKKYSNNYELIYIPNKNNRKNSISIHKPLSRSYFKLWEIIYDFNLFREKRDLDILCLAEGPGGFMESIINFRNNPKDNIYGITLKSTNKDIPGWTKSLNFLKNNNIQITYGSDNTGNLYNIDNIKYIKTFIKKKVDYITADGGFDFSIDFNKQEELSYRIIICEIVSALNILKDNGSFVCKIFDIHTNITVKIIYLLTYYFEKVYITKPCTSRPANSEKYLVCINFKGIDDNVLDLLFLYIKKWDSLKDNILSFIDVPDIFFRKLFIYNNYISLLQIKNIKHTLDLIENDINNKNDIIKDQTKIAIEWCNHYNIRINYNSKFMNKNINY